MMILLNLLTLLTAAIELPIGLISTPYSDQSLIDRLVENLYGLEIQIMNELSLDFEMRIY